MQTITKDLVKLSKVIILGLVVGIGVTYASATWVGPTCQPPECNTPAPLNVGESEQIKLGAVTLNANTTPFEWGLRVFGKSLFEGQVQIKGGNPGLNKVLTSDEAGLASWQTPATSGGMTIVITGLMGTGYNNNLNVGTNWDILNFHGSTNASDNGPSSAVVYKNKTSGAFQTLIVSGTGLVAYGDVTTTEFCNSTDTNYQICFQRQGTDGLIFKVGSLIKGYFVAQKY